MTRLLVRKDRQMKRLLLAILLAIFVIPAASYGQSNGTMTLVERTNNMPYGYVELVGPRTYNIVKGDTLWDLSPNEWRLIQAANPKLSAASRIGHTSTGLYRIHLTVDEAIEIPAGMMIRVRLERPANFVDNPTQGGQPFVPGGVSPDQPDAVRDQARAAAARDFVRNNPGGTALPEHFEIVGTVERGRLYGPGIVHFADQPTLGRPTIYNGEYGYRATVRDKRTGQQKQQMFLQACGNDARRGDALTAGGEGFRFVPEGQAIPSTDPTNGGNATPKTNWGSYAVVGILALMALLAYVAWRILFHGPSSSSSVTPAVEALPALEPPAGTVAAATEPKVLPMAAATEPEAETPRPHLVTATDIIEYSVVISDGIEYTARGPIVVDGKRVRANGEITATRVPEVHGKALGLTKKKPATGTEGK